MGEVSFIHLDCLPFPPAAMLSGIEHLISPLPACPMMMIVAENTCPTDGRTDEDATERRAVLLSVTLSGKAG